MDCPLCGTENLIGATVCAACGKAMISRPQLPPREPTGTGSVHEGRPVRSPTVRSAADEIAAAPAVWGRGDGAAGPGLAASEPAQTMCRVCRSPFDRPADDPDASICPSCRNLSAQVELMVPNEVQIAPATAVEAEAEFRNRMGSSSLRPKPIAVKKVGLRTGPVVAIAGLALTVVGLGVVAIGSRERDPSKELVGETAPAPVSVSAELPADWSVRHEMTLRLTVLREEAHAFGGSASKRLNFRHVSTLAGEATLVRSDERGAIADVTCEGRLSEQTGTVEAEDARDANLYPWEGRRPAVRVRLAAASPLVQPDQSPVAPCAEVVPLFHLGALAPPSLEFRPGDRWKADVSLPVLTDRQGRSIVWPFPAEVFYAGEARHGGLRCAAFRIVAPMPRSLPGPLDEAYNRVAGKVSGAVWIELATGVTAGAELDVDLRVWKDAGRVEDELTIRGRLSLARR